MTNMNKTKVINGENIHCSCIHSWEIISINEGTEKYFMLVLVPRGDAKTINTNNITDGQIVNKVVRFILDRDERRFNCCVKRSPDLYIFKSISNRDTVYGFTPNSIIRIVDAVIHFVVRKVMVLIFNIVLQRLAESICDILQFPCN